MKKILFLLLVEFALWGTSAHAQAVGTATLVWTYSTAVQQAAVTSGATTGFNVYRAVNACPLDGSLPASLALQKAVAVTVLTYADTGLAAGSYCYIVKASGPGGEGDPSNTAGKSLFGAPPGVGTTLIVK